MAVICILDPTPRRVFQRLLGREAHTGDTMSTGVINENKLILNQVVATITGYFLYCGTKTSLDKKMNGVALLW